MEVKRWLLLYDNICYKCILLKRTTAMNCPYKLSSKKCDAISNRKLTSTLIQNQTQSRAASLSNP